MTNGPKIEPVSIQKREQIVLEIVLKWMGHVMVNIFQCSQHWSLRNHFIYLKNFVLVIGNGPLSCITLGGERNLVR